MLGHKKYLELHRAPDGIVSLELAGTDSAASAIAKLWSSDTINTSLYSKCNCDSDVYAYRVNPVSNDKKVNRIGVAKDDIFADFFFIVFYVCFLLVVIIKLETPGNKWVPLFAALPVIAGLCDYIEDFGMLAYLDTKGAYPVHSIFREPFYTIASRLKFGILIFLVFAYIPVRLYHDDILKEVSVYLQSKIRQAWRYRVVLLSLGLFALPLWISDQGQDLLVNINNSDAGVCIFLAIIALTAFLNWWVAKLFFQDVYDDKKHYRLMPSTEPFIPNPEKLKIEKRASRFFGVISFLIPAFAILQALDASKINYTFNFILPVIWLILTAVLFYLVIRRDYIENWYDKRSPGFKKKALGIIAVLIFIMTFVLPLFFRIRFVTRDDYKEMSPLDLTFLSLDLILMAVAFLIFVSLRNKIIPPYWHWLREKIGIPIYIKACLLALSFLLLNTAPLRFSSRLTWNFICIPALFCGFIFYMLLFTWLIRLSKFKKINFTLLLFSVCLILNLTLKNNFHNLRYISRDNDSSDSTSRISLKDYLASWILHRKNEIDTSDKNRYYPVFLVNTYGGGIRASSFTSLVIHKLNDSVRNWDSGLGQPFEHFVFSYSGASGGTIGAAVMCAYRHDFLLNNVTHPMTDSLLLDFYNKDYLTTLVSGTLGRDIWAASAGLDLWYDRSAVQEKLWEHHLEMEWNVNFRNDFYSYWDIHAEKTRYEIPLLFSNTCNVDDGLKGILSPVRLDHNDFPSTDFVEDQTPPKQTIALSTAAFISARFPWISPTAKTGANYHFIDGGIKENSGAETSENIYLALHRFMALPKDSLEKIVPGLSPYIKKIRIFLVSIGNSSHSRSGPERKVTNLFQLTSPLIALYNSGVDGNSHKADSTIHFRYPEDYTSIWPDVDCISYDTLNKADKYSPALPLGWQISIGALRRLASSASKKQYYEVEGDSVPGFARIKRFVQQKH